MDLCMDGLLIESHNEPRVALSDAKQQVTPLELEDIYKDLRRGQERIQDADFLEELESLRTQIDEIDVAMLDLLADRMQIVQGIGEQKREKGVTIFQLQRWRDVMENFLNRGGQRGLSPGFVKKILEAIHLESIEIQERSVRDQVRSKP
jgi:chorismate mutase